MVAYLPYAHYKPSNVDWLGDIPKHWDVWKVTHGFNKIGSGTTPRSDNMAFYDGNIPWVTTSELRETIILDTAQKVTEEAVRLHSALTLYPKGSLAIAMYGATIGRLGMLGVDATFNQACCVFSAPTVFDTRFVYYWLWMRRPILISLSNGGGQPNLSQDDLKKLWIPIPDIDEQQAIARFLDFKTAQIDALIAKKQTLLGKLAEKRTALISHAVTKGLDPKVPMRDSGVVWVGEIPSHWTIRRLKDVGRLIGGAGFPHDLQNVQDEELYFYKVGDLSLSENGKTLLSSPHTINRETAKTLRASVIPKESIVYAKIGAALLLNRRRMTTSECCIDNNMTAYVVNRDRVSPDWAFYWLTTIDFAEHVNPGAVPSFSEGYQSVLSIPLPPIDEQENIVSFLEEHTTQIDRQVKKIEEVIETLLEYRSAIITNAVTGKIDVLDFSIPLPVEGRAI